LFRDDCRSDAHDAQANRGGIPAREPDDCFDVLGERLRRLPRSQPALFCFERRKLMGMGRGILLWLLGVPLPIVILLALFWHH
jgi:hypothetical protein